MYLEATVHIFGNYVQSLFIIIVTSLSCMTVVGWV